MGKVYLKTFGCQMNEYDSQRILSVFRNYGFIPSEIPETADFAMLNTCSVREKPQHKVSSEIGRLKKIKLKNPEFKIGVCGCVAQQEGENILSDFPYVDFVIGTEAVNRLDVIIDAVLNGERVADVEMKSENISIPAFRREASPSAYVTIMKGCNNYCSYCIVPYVRGSEVSRKSTEIIDEIKFLIDSGVKEVTLLGQNVNSYGKNLDENINFPKLLYMIDKIEGLKRLRFVTSHPKDFSREVIFAMRDIDKICEFLHLPLQSGSDRILRNMNRKYDYISYAEKISLAKEEIPGLSLSSDFIVGFPGETEKDFEDTISAIKEIEYESLFAFKYSPRPGTKAEKLDDTVDDKVKSERLEKLLNVQSAVTDKLLNNYIDKDAEVLIEGKSKKDEKIYSGRNRQNRIVNFESDRALNPGDIVNVKITEAKRNSLFGVNKECMTTLKN